ncbi:MAG: hypothetical protein Cons2KO_30300 [Congregibacter sp.]
MQASEEGLLFPVAVLRATKGALDQNGYAQFGIPLPLGWCVDTGQLALVDDEKRSLNAEIRPVVLWPDRSVQWCMIHCRPDFDFRDSVTLGIAKQAPRKNKTSMLKASSVRLDELTGSARVSGDSNLIAVDVRKFRAFDIETTSGAQLVRGTVELRVDGQPITARVVDYEHRTLSGRFGTISHEIVVEGVPGGDNRLDIRLQMRLLVSADAKRIDGSLTIHNAEAASHPGGLWDLGDPKSLRFDSLMIGFELPGSGAECAIRLAPELEAQETQSTVSVKQHASGGNQWNSPVHIDSEHRFTPAYPGYVACLDDRTSEGARAQPVLTLPLKGMQSVPSDLMLSAEIHQFWQQFPTGLKFGDGHLGLFPFANTAATHELQPGERKTRHFTVLLHTKAEKVPKELCKDIRVQHEITHISRCNLPDLASSGTVDPRLQKLVLKGLDADHGFLAKREAIDEYGWRHYGELYADHETEGYQGDRMFVSHYNNQYDPILGFLQQYLLNGDRSWFELADDLAGHVLDIDIYRTRKDRVEYNYGLFWHTDHYLPAETATHRSFSRHQSTDAYEGHAHGGGPGGQHCYTSGFLLHYLLTGNEASREAVYDLRDWITHVYEGDSTLTHVVLALKNKGRTDLKNHLLGQYPLDRGTANYLNAILDCHTLDRRPSALATAESIIRATIHPADNLAARDLLNSEAHWYYIVFLQAVARYLRVSWDTEGPSDAWRYARDALLHYADWMLIHEAPYLDNPDVLEFPNHTWAAQDLRKANVLFAAAEWADSSPDRYVQKAEFFVNYVTNTLASSPTLHYTRILAVLMQNIHPSAISDTARTSRTQLRPERTTYQTRRTPRAFTKLMNLTRLLLSAVASFDRKKEVGTVKRLLPSRFARTTEG